MATNTDKPVGPGTFKRDSHSVTIAEDGKILVKKDDWLSKYSWALYGDYDTLDVFVRPNPAITYPAQEIKGIKEIENVDLIETGEYLIHVPTYFHWMEKRGGKKPDRKKPEQPKTPEQTRTMNWMAANLGGLDGTYFPLAGGAVLLIFRNLNTGTNYYYVLIRGGAGIGLDVGKIVKAVKNAMRALGSAFFLKKAATAKFVPVIAQGAFSARSIEGLEIHSIVAKFSTGGAKQNYSYERISGRSGSFEYFHVIFKEHDWLALPGGAINATYGAMIWVW